MKNALAIGDAFRVAPRRSDGRALAGFWQLHVSGLSVYACSRGWHGLTKVSVHMRDLVATRFDTDRIQFRIGQGPSTMMAQPMPLGTGDWLHAFELRFLFHEDAMLPAQRSIEAVTKKKYGVAVPAGSVLRLGLLIAKAPGAAPVLPSVMVPEFAFVLWRHQLKDQRAVQLVGLLQMDDINKAALQFIWDSTRIDFVAAPNAGEELPQVEVSHIHYSGGGNVILVIPLGAVHFKWPP